MLLPPWLNNDKYACQSVIHSGIVKPCPDTQFNYFDNGLDTLVSPFVIVILKMLMSKLQKISKTKKLIFNSSQIAFPLQLFHLYEIFRRGKVIQIESIFRRVNKH